MDAKSSLLIERVSLDSSLLQSAPTLAQTGDLTRPKASHQTSQV